jgi:hypothetical protein
VTEPRAPRSGDADSGHVEVRTTPDGYWVAKIHYSCVPDYDFDSACIGMSEDQIERELEINWSVSAGLAVYPQFKWDTHVAAGDLQYWPDLPLHLGLDAPGTPALAITQLNPWGQWQIFPSLHPADDQFRSFYEFGEWMAEHLEREYCTPYGKPLKDLKMVIIGDPAGQAVPPRSDSNRQDMRSCWEILRSGVRLFVGEDENGRAMYQDRPGWNWNVIPGQVSARKRVESVRARLMARVGDDLPALIVDPSEDYVIRAFQGLYSFDRRPDGSFSSDPCKDHASHIMDAVAYCASRLQSRSEVRGEDEDGPARNTGVRSQASSFWRNR